MASHQDSADSRAHRLNVLSLRLGLERKLLTANVAIGLDGPAAHCYDPGAANRIVTLPPFVQGGGTTYFIANVGAANNLVVQSANGAAVVTIKPRQSSFVVANEAEWVALRAWADLEVFGISGPNHSVGLVPDPGAAVSAVRFLREDGVWSSVSVAGIVDAYKFITDGTNTATGTGPDTFKLRSSAGTVSVVVTNNDVTHGDVANFNVVEGAINHNALLNYVADQHVAHSGVTFTAGNGLAGGGTLAASRTFDLDLNDLVVATPVLADSVGFYDLSATLTGKTTWSIINTILDHNALLNYSANRHIDHSAVSVIAGVGLSGGGVITASVTLNIDFNEFQTGQAITAADLVPFYDVSEADHNTTTVALFNAALDHNSLLNYVANQHIDHTTVSLNAGGGLSGGGTIASTRTLALDIVGQTEDLTPDSAADFAITWDASASAFKKVKLNKIGKNAFIELTDAPASYSGQALKVVRVNAGATALEFVAGSGSGDVVGPTGATDGRFVLFDGATGKLIKQHTGAPGTAAVLDVGTTANKIVQLDANAKIPAVDGSLLTALTIPQISQLDITLAEIALQVADNSNVALFLGAAGNRLADSFDALTFVNTGGATNLDSSVAGLLKPTIALGAQIAQGTGTVIGDMTTNGGIASVFDGVTNQANPSSAAKLGTTAAYVGKNYSPAKTIGQVITYGTNDVNGGYLAGSTASVTLNLRAKHTSPANSADGTLLGTTTFANTAATNSKTIPSSDLTTEWEYVWVEISCGSSVNMTLAELEFYTSSISNLTVTSTTLTAASVPTVAKLVARVNEISSITLNTDLIFSASRDGGTTYTAFTMTDRFTASGAHVLESNSLDISGQPSGTSMRWKCVTANNKMIELWDVYFYWT